MAAQPSPLKRLRLNAEGDAAAVAVATGSLWDRTCAAVVQLQERGYAVVEGVLDEAECATLWDLMWDFIEGTTQGRVDRADPSTWRKEWPVALHWILKNYNVGQSQPTWYVRASVAVITVFAYIYGTDKLFCSFDGFAMIPDAKKMDGHDDAARAGLRENHWLHFDQSPHLAAHLLCVQAWVTCREVNTGAATLTVLPGSHKKLGEFVGPTTKAGNPDLCNWFKPSTQEIAAVFGENWQDQLVRVECPRGSMVLWDSRTMHQGGVPLFGYPNAVKERGVVYVCFAPAAQCEAAGRGAERRKELCDTERTTNHWPQLLTLNGKAPRNYGQVLPPTTDLTGQRQELAAKHPHLKERLDTLAGGDGAAALLGWTSNRPALLNIEDPTKVREAFRRSARTKK